MKPLVPIYLSFLALFVFIFWRINTPQKIEMTNTHLPQIYKELENDISLNEFYNEQMLSAFRSKAVELKDQAYESLMEDLRDSLITINQRTREVLNYIVRLDSSYEALEKISNDKYLSPPINTYFLGENQYANNGRGNGVAKVLKDTLQNYYTWIATIYNSDKPDSMKWYPERVFLKSPNNQTWEQSQFKDNFLENRIILTLNKLNVMHCESRMENKLKSTFSYLWFNCYLEFKDEDLINPIPDDAKPQYRRKRK